MKYTSKNYSDLSSWVEVSTLEVAQSEVAEQMCIIHTLGEGIAFDKQLNSILNTYNRLKEEQPQYVPIFIRVFLSDSANQELLVKNTINENCPISIIEQPPLDGSKISIWVYFMSGVKVENGNFSHNGYTHLWSVDEGKTNCNNSYIQTAQLLDNYVADLAKVGATLLNDTIRTWFFVQNVDVNYKGVVEGRNAIFDQEGLLPSTHFITSTGIGGRVADHNITTVMDAYTVLGLEKEQIQFLYAPTHLNSTYEYGVRFERGTAVHYGDRSHVFISGTASIDNKGEVVHVGDIEKQVERMWENVEVLLAETDCNFSNVAQMIVYLRDISDYTVVRKMYDKRFADVPKVFVLAPVCRPTWLIEMECIAIKECLNEYPIF